MTKILKLIKKQKTPLLLSLAVAGLSIVLAFGIGLVFAWTEPGSSPPGGNVPAPLNVGPGDQVKTGNITVGGGGAGYLYVGNRGYYIGDDLGGSDIQTNAPNIYVYDGSWKRLCREGDGGACGGGGADCITCVGGRAGIGTASPAAQLDVRGGWNNLFRFDGGSDDNGRMYATYEGASPYLDLIEYDDPFVFRFRQTSYGDTGTMSFYRRKVGINTTNPGYTLDVQGGQINASGGFCIDTSCITNWSQAGGADLNGWSFADNYFYDDGEEVIRADDEWLRLNQAGHFTSGVHTPGLFAPKSLSVNIWSDPGAGNIRASGSIYNYATPQYSNGMSTYVMNTDYWYESNNDGGWMYAGTQNAELNIRGSVLFDCPSCGSASALDGGSNWGDMTIQGRVMSANSNIHLSPPAGYSVIINDSYRAAGGAGGGKAHLSVEGNITVGGKVSMGWQRITQSCSSQYCEATCPGGYRVVGGGCEASGPIQDNRPHRTDPRKWSCYGAGVNMEAAYAICLRVD